MLSGMVPAGYMAKRVEHAHPKFLEWIRAPHISEIYSVSNCMCDDFADYIRHWKHNGYWFFDSPGKIREVAKEASASLEGTILFYYEVHESEFDGSTWCSWYPEASFRTNVVQPSSKHLEGFDVVTFSVKTSPECSPLSCNGLAKELATNQHCLFATFEAAESALNTGAFKDAEPGPYRIFAVYSVPWSSTNEQVIR
jgi:hypothetical protein